MWRRLSAAAGISMIVGALLWYMVPERREAFATVRIQSMQPGVLPTPIYDPVEFATFKRTQAQLVKSGMVVRAALRQLQIAKLATIQAKGDAVEWLTGKLTVDFPDDGEIMRIGLRGEMPADAVKIVDAVVQSYMSEIVGENKSREAMFFQSTEKQYQVLREEFHKSATALAMQQKIKGVVGTPVAQAKKEVAARNLDDAISYRNQVRHKVRELALQIELEKAKRQREVKTAEGEQTESPRLWELEKERELQEAELAATEESVELGIRALSNLEVYASDLDQVRRGLQLQSEILDEFAAKIQRRRVEQFAPERITMIDPATVESPAFAMVYLGPAILAVCGVALVTFSAWPRLISHNSAHVTHS